MIFEKIYDTENLRAAWERVRINKGAPGIDRVTWSDFEKDLAYNLTKLRNQLKEGTYRPLPVVVFKDTRTKATGRSIGIAAVRDRVVQQAILRAMGPRLEQIFLPCSFAYRPRKSALAAVNKAAQLIKAGQLWVLQLDVESFFDSLDHRILLDLIKRVVNERALLRLVAKLLEAKIFKEMGLFDNTVGAHQGSGLSPLLSNLYLHPLDRLMWDRYKDRYLRYSDDIALFSTEKDELEEARNSIEQALAELKLKAHDGKTSISHVSSGITYLGFFLDSAGKGPDRKSVEHLQSKLEVYSKVRRTDDIAEKLTAATAAIRGWYNYYRTLKPLKPENALTCLALAAFAQETGQNQLAKEILKKSEKFKRGHPEIAFRLGEQYSSLGMAAQAIREYARSLQMEPHLEKAKERIRKIQEETEGSHQAIEKTQLVLHHNPHYREGYERLAELYCQLGLYGFAEKAHQKAMELDEETGQRREELSSLEEYRPSDFDYRAVGLEEFLSFFKGREGVHAKQWVDERGRWGFLRVERQLKARDLYKHLKGEETLAIYPVTVRDTVHFIVFDVDTAKRVLLETTNSALAGFRRKAHEDLLRIKTVTEHLGLSLYIEDSGYKGRHGWLFFSSEVPAQEAIALGREVMKRAGGPSEGMIWELFPMGKSERHNSLIKLPLGINRKSNKRCLFLTDDNRPLPDQALFLRSMKRNSFVELKPRLASRKPSRAAEKDSLSESFPPSSAGLARMLKYCRILNHLVAKARDTNYLNHFERLCLLYTISFAGDEGRQVLHKIMSWCINYDSAITQRQIERRKQSPISCPRIMELFPELAETLPCNCKFELPPRGYPSPVLYLLQAEMEAADIWPLPGREDAETRAESPADKVDSSPESQGVPILDFEAIFSAEAGVEMPHQKHQSVVTPRNTTASKDFSVSGKMPALPEAGGEESVQPPAANVLAKSCEPGFLDEKHTIALWKTASEYLKLKSDQQKLRMDFNQLEAKLESYLDQAGTDHIRTAMGTVRKRKKPDGSVEWDFSAV